MSGSVWVLPNGKHLHVPAAQVATVSGALRTASIAASTALEAIEPCAAILKNWAERHPEWVRTPDRLPASALPASASTNQPQPRSTSSASKERSDMNTRLAKAIEQGARSASSDDDEGKKAAIAELKKLRGGDVSDDEKKAIDAVLALLGGSDDGGGGDDDADKAMVDHIDRAMGLAKPANQGIQHKGNSLVLGDMTKAEARAYLAKLEGKS